MRRLDQLLQILLIVGAFIFIIGLFLIIDQRVTDLERKLGFAMVTLAWVFFVADYTVRLIRAENRREHVTGNRRQSIAVVVPPAIILVIPDLIRDISASARSKFGTRVRLYVFFLTIAVVSLGSVLEVIAERGAPGATIQTLGDAVWWSMETISTVGYGDYYPVTPLGKAVAVCLFVNGVALLSVVTASLAGKVLGENEPSSGGDTVNLNDIQAQQQELSAQLAMISDSLRRPGG